MDTALSQLLQRAPVLVNVGVRMFGESLVQEGYDVIQVNWSPPAGGDAEMAVLLDQML